jgi:hypothetical protein
LARPRQRVATCAGRIAPVRIEAELAAEGLVWAATFATPARA